MTPRRLAVLAFALATPWGCGSSVPAPTSHQTHSSGIAISPDGAHLYVVHPDGDTVSVLDVATRSIQHEILLANTAPSVDPTSQRFEP
ncbi:MAG TPA: hypothetical protein VIJ22_09370, partial [Polyangiaceae bacterium]